MSSSRPSPQGSTSLSTGERWTVVGLAGLACMVPLGAWLGPSFFPSLASPTFLSSEFIAGSLVLSVALAVFPWRTEMPAVHWLIVGASSLTTLAGAVVAMRAPTYAASLALLAGVLAALTLPGERNLRWRDPALMVALGGLLVQGIGVMGHQIGVPLLVDDEQSSPGAGVMLVLLSAGLLFAGGARRRLVDLLLGAAKDAGEGVPVLERRRRRVAELTMAGLCVALTGASYAYLRLHLGEMQGTVATELTNLAELKVAQIEDWRRERLGDLRTLARAPFLAESLAALRGRRGDATVRESLQTYLEEFRRNYDYHSAVLTDANGAVLFAAGNRRRRTEALSPAMLNAAAQTNDAVIDDLHTAADGTPSMEFIAPVRSAEGALTGLVRLQVAARAHLFPIIERWPAESRSGEMLLLRREGGSAVFLNHLRFRADSALKLTVPLGQPGQMAAMAVIQRRVDLRDGLDYRGARVLWVARAVADSPWVVVAKIDRREAYGPIRAAAWRSAGLFAASLLAVGLMVGNHWRRRQRESEQRHHEAERERRSAVERLTVVLRHANDVILLFDEKMGIVEANERALEVYGRTMAEMRQLTAPDLRAPATQAATERDFAQALTPQGLVFETTHQRKDGSTFEVEVSAQRVEIDGRPHVLSIIRDITERKRLAAETARQEARFRLIFDLAPVGLLLTSPDGGEELVNAEHERITGAAAAGSPVPGALACVPPPADSAGPEAGEAGFLRGETDHFTVEKRYLRADGSVAWAQLTKRLFRDPATGAPKALTTLVDLTQRKLHEAEIERLNRVYLVISRVNQVLVRVKNRAELFAGVCHVLVEVGGFRLAWVGRLNTATDAIEPVAAAGDEGGYLPGLRIATDAMVPEGRGPTGTAVREARTCVCNDFFADPATVPWRERAARAGFQSVIALPLRCEGRVLGVLTVHAAEKDFFAPREVGLLEETAANASFALEVFLGEERRREAEAAVRASERRLQFLITSTPAIIYSLGVGGDYRTTYLSPNLTEVLGYDPEQARADPDFWAAHLHPDDAATASAAIAHLGGEDVVSREYRFRHADGSWRWMRDETRLVRDAQGRPQEYVGSWLDITSRKEAEEALGARERIFSTIVEQAADGIVLVDPGTTRFVEFNTAAHESLGYSRAEFAALVMADVVVAPVPEQIQRDLRGLSHVRGVTSEARHRHRNGDLRDVRVSARSVRVRGHDYVAAVWSDITEAKRAEAEMRKLSLVVEQSPISVVITDLTGTIEYVNPRFAQLTGYTLDELRGTNPRVLKSGLTAPAVYKDLWRTITQGRVWRGEIINRKKTGECFTELAVITPVTDAAGRPTHYLAVKEDISERRQAELALAASETMFRRLLAHVPLPLVHCDGAGRITFINERFQRLFGYTLDAVPTVQAWWARACPDAGYRSGLLKKWEQAVADAAGGSGEFAGFETNVTCRDGQIRNVELSAITLGNEILVAFVDMTDRVRAEKRLRQLSRTIEQAPLSVAITDLNGAIEYVNPRFCEVTGYTVAEVLGQNPRVLKSGETPAAVYTEMWETLTRGQVWRGELHNKKKSGEGYVERAVIAPVADDSGRVTHYVALKEDITAHRRTEAALRETQERYRLIAENSDDVIWLYDLASRVFTYMSPSSERLLGFKPAELIGQPITRALTPDAATEAEADVARQLAAYRGGDHGAIYRVALFDYQHRHGRVLRGEVVSTLLLDAGGEPRQLLGITRDVTERERTAEQLRQNRDRLAKAEQMAHLGHWEFDLRTKQIFWSDELFRLFEIEQGSHRHLLKRFLARVHPEDLRRGKLAFGRAAARQTRFDLNLRLRFAAGRTKHVEASGAFTYSRDGQPLVAVGTVLDITARRQVEIAMHELVKQLRAMHGVAVALEQTGVTRETLLTDIVRHLPGLMSEPAAARACIEVEGCAREAGAAGEWRENISAPILINGQPAGTMRVGYVRPAAMAGDERFTAQERETIGSIARTVGLSLGAREAFTAIQRFNAELEERIQQRTAELAERNHQVQALLEAIPDMVLRMRRDGTLLHSQSAKGATPLANLSLQPAGGRLAAGAAELHSAVREVGTRACAEGATIGTEVRLALEAHATTLELRAAPNGPEEFIVFVRDITARRRLEDALKESKDRLALATRAGGVGIWDWSVNTGTLVWDEQMFRLYGLTPDRFSGTYDAWRHAIHPGDLAGVETEIQRALRGEQDFHTEFRVVWPDTSTHYIRALGLVQRDAAGRPIQMVGTNWEITAQKNLEREIAANLEKERQISEMKTRFISVTSHEFRTPMAAAMGSAELLRNHFDRLPAAKREELLARITGSMHRMTDMLDEVLTLNRIDAGRMQKQLTRVNLEELVHNVVGEVRMGDRDAHHFVLKTDGDASGFTTDTNLLHHILSNLLSNAARYSAAGTTITTGLQVEARRAWLSIEDEGIGIPEADLKRIFDPFERGSNVGTIKGTGLGLNIVKRMVEMLGGRVAVETVVDRGSRFTVELPQPDPPAAA
ncbi:MAG: PAS domain S-box protein [Verrucomicrobia bacterium]|nr:PAS domain S-box protein [Verrucomicrobiota bacterium]